MGTRTQPAMKMLGHIEPAILIVFTKPVKYFDSYR